MLKLGHLVPPPAIDFHRTRMTFLAIRDRHYAQTPASLQGLREKAYDEMYDARSSSAATGRYSDAKEAFHDAIAIARELELPDEMAAIQARLGHIKAVSAASSHEQRRTT